VSGVSNRSGSYQILMLHSWCAPTRGNCRPNPARSAAMLEARRVGCQVHGVLEHLFVLQPEVCLTVVCTWCGLAALNSLVIAPMNAIRSVSLANTCGRQSGGGVLESAAPPPNQVSTFRHFAGPTCTHVPLVLRRQNSAR
jgi:hypothetical protein